MIGLEVLGLLLGVLALFGEARKLYVALESNPYDEINTFRLRLETEKLAYRDLIQKLLPGKNIDELLKQEDVAKAMKEGIEFILTEGSNHNKVFANEVATALEQSRLGVVIETIVLIGHHLAKLQHFAQKEKLAANIKSKDGKPPSVIRYLKILRKVPKHLKHLKAIRYDIIRLTTLINDTPSTTTLTTVSSQTSPAVQSQRAASSLTLHEMAETKSLDISFTSKYDGLYDAFVASFSNCPCPSHQVNLRLPSLTITRFHANGSWVPDTDRFRQSLYISKKVQDGKHDRWKLLELDSNDEEPQCAKIEHLCDKISDDNVSPSPGKQCCLGTLVAKDSDSFHLFLPNAAKDTPDTPEFKTLHYAFQQREPQSTSHKSKSLHRIQRLDIALNLAQTIAKLAPTRWKTWKMEDIVYLPPSTSESNWNPHIDLYLSRTFHSANHTNGVTKVSSTFLGNQYIAKLWFCLLELCVKTLLDFTNDPKNAFFKACELMQSRAINKFGPNYRAALEWCRDAAICGKQDTTFERDFNTNVICNIDSAYKYFTCEG